VLLEGLKRGFQIRDMPGAKKFLFPSGPVGIWIKIQLNLDSKFA
jgi:hypothetical protein